MQKPKYTPTLSLGNVLTLLGGTFVAAGIWVALEVSDAEARGAINKNEKAIQDLDARNARSFDDLEGRISRLEQRTEKRLDSIDSKLDRLLDRSK